MSQHERPPALRLAAVCGLPCEACSLFIGSHDDPARLQALAAKTQRPIEQLRCEGCRSERRAVHCEQCEFVACAGKRGIDFCGQCTEYPCERLTSFQAAMPHRIELWEDQGRIAAIGHERWLLEKRAHYSCPQCQTVNAAYDRRCWTCGHEPSCTYVDLHRQSLLDHPVTRA